MIGGTVTGLTAARSQEDSPRRVALANVELHYVERGQGEPVVLLHGGQGDYRAWPAQMDALASRYRAISYSRRYHYPNDNPMAGTNHSAWVEAADLAGFMGHLRLGPVHLVGTSYGAFTAIAFALRQPELVRSLVLAEPPIHPWAAVTPRGAALYREFMTQVHDPAGRAFGGGDDIAAMRIFIDTFDGVGTFDRLPTDRRTTILQNARFFKALTASSEPYPDLPKDRVRRLRMPVLIVRGADTDELHRLVTEEVARVLPAAQRAVVPAAGHGSPRQNASAFNEAVLSFLKQQTR